MIAEWRLLIVEVMAVPGTSGINTHQSAIINPERG
jgi:hypothetical protein